MHVFFETTPLKAKSVNALVEEFSERAGMRITPHAIRHWFGQSCADLRLPPTVTQALMDHADVKTTLHYYYYYYYYNQDRVRIDDALQTKSILGNPRTLIKFPHNLSNLSSGYGA